MAATPRSMPKRIVFMVEEESLEIFLSKVLPKVIQRGACSWKIIRFQGKMRLLANLQSRLKAYAHQSGQGKDYFIVLVDQDDDDCHVLKQKLEAIAQQVNMATPAMARKQGTPSQWKVAFRIVVDRLEAWYLDEWQALKAAYPRLRGARHIQKQGVNSETALKQVFKKHGYYTSGLPKCDIARKVGEHFHPARCASLSFQCFVTLLQSIC